MKALISLIFAIFLIQLVSAHIIIEPSIIHLNYQPADSITKNITIKTSGSYAVHLSHKILENISNNDLTISYENPVMVERQRTIPIEFNFSSGAEIRNITIELEAEIDVDFPTQIVYVPEVQYRTGGGGAIYYQNKTLSDLLKTKDKIIEDLNSLMLSLNNTSSNQTQEGVNIENEKTIIKLSLLLFILIVVLIVLIFVYLKKLKGGAEQDERTTDTNKERIE